MFRGQKFDGGYAEMEGWANRKAEWADGPAEGIYVKVFDTKQVTHRFKMVRESFVRGEFWNPEAITKNLLAEKPDGTPEQGRGAAA